MFNLFYILADLKLYELAEKFKELEKSGKVEKFLAKKRKKQLTKDRIRLEKEKYDKFV